jgi:hypothetical protein
MAANIPVALWGKPGIGKSSLIKQILNELPPITIGKEKREWKLFDFRLSDKEPSDLGGIPFPIEGARVKFLVIKPDEEHPENGLPFDSDVPAIVLLDEFDRADLSVQNVALQIILDRRVNGHYLSLNARIILAGNATTDVGTTPLSKAAANRIVHLYITSDGEPALNSYLDYAEKAGVSPILRGFARFKQNVWNGNSTADKNEIQMEEMAYATPRSFDYADRICMEADKAKYKTSDIIRAVVAGCVGVGPATEFLQYRDTFSKAPNIFDIIDNPEKIEVPKVVDVLYSLTLALTDYASEEGKLTAKEKEEKAKIAIAVAKYGLRWPEEPAAFLFKKLREKAPSVETSAPFKEWKKRDRYVEPSEIDVTEDGYCMNCKEHVKMKNIKKKTLPNGRPVVEGTCIKCNQVTNRIGDVKK